MKYELEVPSNLTKEEAQEVINIASENKGINWSTTSLGVLSSEFPILGIIRIP